MADIELLTQGAEGRVFTSKWLGKDVIIKHRFQKNYRHPDLDALITKERIKAEAKSLVRCRMIGINVPALYDVNMQANEIVMENLSNADQVRKFIYERNVDAAIVLSLATEIGHTLAKLHDNDIIHGDLTTSNILIDKKSFEPIVIYLIDFGLSFVSEQVEDKAVDLYVLERAILSTHPNSDNFLKHIWDAYRDMGNKASKVLSKLDEVRTRGRKKLCFG